MKSRTLNIFDIFGHYLNCFSYLSPEKIESIEFHKIESVAFLFKKVEINSK